MREDHPKALLVAVSWTNMMDEVSNVLLRSCTSSPPIVLRDIPPLLVQMFRVLLYKPYRLPHKKRISSKTRTEKIKKKKKKLEKISIAKKKPEFLSEDRYEGGSPEGVVGRRVLDKHDG
ncbi:hypothetical protein CDAR_242521 [Caerostris darwini]|uniref:Uncharacterized protein n=1 Tax=Caerostris darwini TaxID=1538125 RepID=A0AAV4UN62_9ARAC|nr:hypothetical protein CDAR_242521 [Caerostris darwini]